jgi:DNA-binding transcriptional MerR regulator
MFSSGEFSKIANLSIKALRLYHEVGILIPKLVDPETAYRYYDYDNVERARTIVLLRQMMFSVEDIKALLTNCNDDVDALAFLESQRTQLENKIREMRLAKSALDKIVESERRALSLFRSEDFKIEEKVLPPVRIAGIRLRGTYSDIDKVFAKLGRHVGGVMAGKPLGLFYDQEYKESDADFEGCFPVRKEKIVDGISFRELPEVRAVTLVYKGPYSNAGRSYAKVHGYINERGYKGVAPSREIYIKGPGMIFKGNPNNYLTEIQMPVEVAGA